MALQDTAKQDSFAEVLRHFENPLEPNRYLGDIV